MRDALKNLFSNQIILEDNSLFYYTITPYELTNALGNIIAVLLEYNFTDKDDNAVQFFCKLYKTKEGNWYDIEEAKIGTEKSILRMLKSAIDAKENSTVLK
ncbi:hypothetical protein [Ferruginibacter sp.]|nr:hypothetical protein [Ferruginibacter sp.]